MSWFLRQIPSFAPHLFFLLIITTYNQKLLKSYYFKAITLFLTLKFMNNLNVSFVIYHTFFTFSFDSLQTHSQLCILQISSINGNKFYKCPKIGYLHPIEVILSEPKTKSIRFFLWFLVKRAIFDEFLMVWRSKSLGLRMRIQSSTKYD